MEASRKTERMVAAEGKEVAPFLCGVNAFAEHRLRFSKAASAKPGTPSAATVEATWPISSDEVVARDVGDLQGWSAFRLGKFYEALDALTADAAYLHTDGHARGLALVTAGHYFSRKLARTVAERDVTIRCYPTSVGSSSLEIRTDALQNSEHGTEKLLNSCHTVMVCVDAETLKPVKGVVPALEADPDDAGQGERTQLAALHAQVRKWRANESISLYSRHLTKPPDDTEMAAIHALHREATRTDTVTVAEHTHAALVVAFPERRNVHGKTFGGFVAAQAFDLAYCAAIAFTQGRPFASLGIDEATFLQPVAIGDLVSFQCRVVHVDTLTGVFRISINVDVPDKRQLHARPNRTNFLRFIFAADPAYVKPVLPVSYAEILGFVNAARRNEVEPIAQATLAEISSFVRVDSSS